MDSMQASRLIDAAMGRIPCDMAVRNASVVDTFSRKVFRSDVYIIDGLIAGFGGERKALEEMDAESDLH